jgi:aspartyl-tRNA(Asn)/glutamyl-tRNA(Gln) amidotransferase subunit C
MGLSKETVHYVADLSRMELDPGELEKLSRQLESILDFIDRLREIDISAIPPTSHILPLSNVFREDTPAKCLPIEKTLANAPAKEDDFFSVPKVIE